MTTLTLAIKPLENLRKIPEWSGFFDRIDRLLILDELIAKEPIVDRKNSVFRREAARKVKWLFEFRIDYTLRVNNLKHFESLVEVYDLLLGNEHFESEFHEPSE